MIDRSFFQRDPLTCAQDLIGCTLDWGECTGIIVETEAYTALNDEAAHTFSRPSARAFVAKHVAGTAYVYFNYGMYWLVNVLVKGGPRDGFVLFRAVEPVRGVEKMMVRRKQEKRTALCSGPGKLTQAFGITGADHGRDLCTGEAPGFRHSITRPTVVSDVRVGISRAAHLPWRYLLAGSSYVSVRHGRVSIPAKKDQAS